MRAPRTLLVFRAYLELNNNNIGGVIPGVLGSLQSLIDINLNTNKLVDAVPDSLGDLNLLSNLNLGGNWYVARGIDVPILTLRVWPPSLTMPWPPTVWALCQRLGESCNYADGSCGRVTSF